MWLFFLQAIKPLAILLDYLAVIPLKLVLRNIVGTPIGEGSERPGRTMLAAPVMSAECEGIVPPSAVGLVLFSFEPFTAELARDLLELERSLYALYKTPAEKIANLPRYVQETAERMQKDVPHAHYRTAVPMEMTGGVPMFLANLAFLERDLPLQLPEDFTFFACGVTGVEAGRVSLLPLHSAVAQRLYKQVAQAYPSTSAWAEIIED
ncbi:hypothetical protein [Blastopirellula marina]|uniref:Uncharacterized protein n=1 Tax=Blastopirellula marina TaxID=124 RepID=A0A2S8FWE1_9BACT|nr:hypothetical protein [Blastopirellula marina]PQO36502.1 hypothetical protein C5Y98_12445 [Blastopirellula marina]PTL44340.1 hypothetical protein C5Y97_12455 [Blastopirellula marina]